MEYIVIKTSSLCVEANSESEALQKFIEAEKNKVVEVEILVEKNE